jgi:uncharacterized protein (TIGR01732 family)
MDRKIVGNIPRFAKFHISNNSRPFLFSFISYFINGDENLHPPSDIPPKVSKSVFFYYLYRTRAQFQDFMRLYSVLPYWRTYIDHRDLTVSSITTQRRWFIMYGYGRYGYGGYGGHGYGGYGGGGGFGSSFALIVVLFILLIIVGATIMTGY